MAKMNRVYHKCSGQEAAEAPLPVVREYGEWYLESYDADQPSSVNHAISFCPYCGAQLDEAREAIREHQRLREQLAAEQR